MADRRGAGPSAAALGNEVSRKSDGKRLAVATMLAILFDALACGALGALLAGAARTATSDEAATWLSVQLEPQTPAGTELAAERPQERALAVGTAEHDRLASGSVPVTVPARAAGAPEGTELGAAASAEAAVGPSAARAPTSGPEAGLSIGAHTGNGSAGTELDAAPIATREDILVRLDEAIKRKLQYPPRARERGIEGRVLLEILVDEGGALRNCAVETSSGSPMLDTAARRLLSDIFPLRARLVAPFSAFVAVEYRLR